MFFSTFSQSGFLLFASLCSHTLCRFKESSSSPSRKGGSQLMSPLLSFSGTGWISEPLGFFLWWRITSGSLVIDLHSFRNFLINLCKPGVPQIFKRKDNLLKFTNIRSLRWFKNEVITHITLLYFQFLSIFLIEPGGCSFKESHIIIGAHTIDREEPNSKKNMSSIVHFMVTWSVIMSLNGSKPWVYFDYTLC